MSLTAEGDLFAQNKPKEEPKTKRLFPYQKWQSQIPQLRQKFATNAPFPHIQLESFLEDAVLKRALDEFPKIDGQDWIHYKHFNENKAGKSKRKEFPPFIGQVIDELQSPEFVAWLSELTGIEGLQADPTLDGGGMHMSRRGGFLNIHTDFSTHHTYLNWQRRVNLLVYLNENWKEEWGGALELWDKDVTKCVSKCFPIFNHAVIFKTDSLSFHGHPHPIECPEDVTRKSFALYYYTVAEQDTIAPKSTNYRGLPSDGVAKKSLIWLDKQAIWVYSELKRRFKFSDDFASNVLDSIFGKK